MFTSCVEESVLSQGRGHACRGILSFHSFKPFKARSLYHCSYCRNTAEASQSTVSARPLSPCVENEPQISRHKQPRQLRAKFLPSANQTKLNCIVCPHAEQNNFLARRVLFLFVLFFVLSTGAVFLETSL